MMPWARNDTAVIIQTPAKLNLFLEVVGKRGDGFHDLQTVITPIDCFDRLAIAAKEEKEGNDVTLNCRWKEGLVESSEIERIFGKLPPPTDNLVFKAAELFRNRCGINRGLDIDLIKSIPSQAGLGGASSNAAGTLLALNELFETNLSVATLLEWSAELGSDVPFFVESKLAMCEGRGEIVSPLSQTLELFLVVVKPDFGLSTPEIFAHLEIDKARRELPPDFDQQKDFDWSGNLFNRLQLAVEKSTPEITRICQSLLDLGCTTSLMTGSGSCCYGICESADQADEIAGKYASSNSGFVFTCRNL